MMWMTGKTCAKPLGTKKRAFVLDRACLSGLKSNGKTLEDSRPFLHIIWRSPKSLEKSISCATASSSTARLIALIFSRALHQHTQIWIFIHKYHWEDSSPSPICGLHGQRWDGNILATYHINYICVMFCSLIISWIEYNRERCMQLKIRGTFSECRYEHVTLLSKILN